MNLLPSIYTFYLADIIFYQSLKNPTDEFYVIEYTSFCNNAARSSDCNLNNYYVFISNNQARNLFL